MTSKKIAVDVDDTLYGFGELAREKWIEYALEKGDKSLMRGAYCEWGEWRSPSDVVSLDIWLEIIDRCHEDSVILRQTPFKGSVETLNELSDDGYELLYISNRRPDSEPATRMWLVEQGYPQTANLICTSADKAPLVRDCQYLIDDRPKTLVQFVYDYHWRHLHGEHVERKGFGLFGEYNRALTDVPGIYLAPNWELLRRYLIDKGVLNAPILLEAK